MTEVKTDAEVFYPTPDADQKPAPDYWEVTLAKEKAERETQVEAAEAAKDNSGVKQAVADALAEQSEAHNESLTDALLADAKAQMEINRETFSKEDLAYVGDYIRTQAPDLADNPLIADPAYIKSVLAQRKET